MDSLEREKSRSGGAIYTIIRPFETFNLAEAYHQKYYLQGKPELFREIKAIYPDVKDLVNSTAAARINGYLGGNGSLEMLEQQISTLGLSGSAENELLKLGRQILRNTSDYFYPVVG